MPYDAAPEDHGLVEQTPTVEDVVEVWIVEVTDDSEASDMKECLLKLTHTRLAFGAVVADPLEALPLIRGQRFEARGHVDSRHDQAA